MAATYVTARTLYDIGEKENQASLLSVRFPNGLRLIFVGWRERGLLSHNLDSVQESRLHEILRPSTVGL